MLVSLAEVRLHFSESHQVCISLQNVKFPLRYQVIIKSTIPPNTDRRSAAVLVIFKHPGLISKKSQNQIDDSQVD